MNQYAVGPSIIYKIKVISIIWVSTMFLIGKVFSKDQIFHFKKGINLGVWFTNASLSRIERDTFYTIKEIQFIKSKGLDHVRLPINDEVLWDSSGNINTVNFDLLKQKISLLNQLDLNVILDLHRLKVHYYNAAAFGTKNSIWTDTISQKIYLSRWQELSKQLKSIPTNKLAYELLNEPVAPKCSQWNQLLRKAIQVIRQQEKERVIFVGSNRWQSVNTFDSLEVPSNDHNLILTFHFYEPFLLTHVKAKWEKFSSINFIPQYPGITVDKEQMNSVPDSMLKYFIPFNKYYSIDSLKKLVLKAVLKSKKLSLKIYCGEWGVMQQAPSSSASKWLSDMVSIFNEYSIPWAYWQWKASDFGITDRTTKIDRNYLHQLFND
jgi:endoglucanase